MTELHCGENPLVSIIIPIFNRENLVDRVLNTVLNQTYRHWELLLIDDASTDDTKVKIDSLCGDDTRVKCIDNVHCKGPSGARNTGLDYATGKYIAYQDSDDEWINVHLETMVRYLEKYSDKIDLMTADPLRKYEGTEEVFNYDKLDVTKISYSKLDEGYLFAEEEIFDKQLRGRVVTTQCMVGKAELMKSVRWNEKLNAAVDIMHNLELCAKNIGVCHISEYHAIYWAHDDNLTNVSGVHSPNRMERVHGAFALYWELVLAELKLTYKQEEYVKSNLAKCYAWHLGYETFEPQNKFLVAIEYYKKALKLLPNDAHILKALRKAKLKLFLSKFGLYYGK
ncbi:MAG: hypothetical protein COB03_02845 [Alteromonas sp.]|nr:MAG: hypothetical protein COB03_02845 [Alteromonas sp.]